MALIDFLKPATSDAYATAFVPNIQLNQNALAMWLDSTYITYANTPNFAKRYNSSTGLFEQYNSGSWSALVVNYVLKGGDTMSGQLTMASASISFSGRTTSFTGSEAQLNRTGAESTNVGQGPAIQFTNTTTSNTALIQQYTGGMQFYGFLSGGSWQELFRANTVAINFFKPLVFTSGAGAEQIRITHDSGYLCGYNSSNGTRTGYLQFNTGANITLAAEGSAGLIFTTAGVALVFGSGGTAKVTGTALGNGLFQVAGPFAVLDSSQAYLFQIISTAGSTALSAFSATGQSLNFLTTPSGGGAASRLVIDSLGNSKFSGGVQITGATSGISYSTTSGLVFQNAGAGPEIIFTNAGGATDSKIWDVYASSAALNWRIINDANSTALSWLTVTRNAVASAVMAFGGQITVAGSASTTPVAMTMTATTTTADMRSSNVFTGTLTGNIPAANIAWSNFSDGQTINFFFTQDATGSRTVTWPASFKWPGGIAGVLSTAANAVDLLVITYRAATGFFYCTLAKGFA